MDNRPFDLRASAWWKFESGDSTSMGSRSKLKFQRKVLLGRELAGGAAEGAAAPPAQKEF